MGAWSSPNEFVLKIDVACVVVVVNRAAGVAECLDGDKGGVCQVGNNMCVAGLVG